MAKKKSPADNPAPNPVSPVPVVGIGASAGGIEAVVELMTNLSPQTGLAYVYIQHLDPATESGLIRILEPATSMPVLEARHLMRIEPNHVYVIPPDHDVEVIDGVLMLMPLQNKGGKHMPIDQFFISLADRQKEGTIAVLLSGVASDGTLGLRAVKAAGGITFAQDDTARFQSMPKSAIAEDLVDQVLPPVEIARELERISRHSDIFRQTELAEEVSEDNDEDLRSIILMLRKSIGVDFTHYKMTTIRRRIIRRMLLFKLDTLKEYAQYLRQYPDEMGLLYGDLLINVTTFFRDEDTMDYLKKVLLPRILKDKSLREPIRIWVPACSTGQEAYSLAMLLLEILGDQASSRTIQIFATDLSEAAINRARQGSYTRSEVAEIAPRRLQRFFTKIDTQYRINRNVRDMCVFAPQNILKDPPFSRLDLISCRNLLIYLDGVFQRKAISMFHYALNPNGCLVLGKSETVGSLTTLFTQIEKNYKVYSRKNDVANRVTFQMNPPTIPDRVEKGAGSQEGEQGDGQDGDERRNAGSDLPVTINNLDKVVDDLLLRQYVPASVVVNQDLDILQFRGSTSLFLEPAPGKASLNLLKMARPSLAFELRNAVHKARKSRQTVRKTGLEVKIKDQKHPIAIEVVPLSMGSEEQLFLVLFEEIIPIVPIDSDATEMRNRRIKQLEEELATLREDMRSIIDEQEVSNEELQSANEEIISSNEELQSINEELETSKEEIESTNEELLTINQEFQVRNDQLSEANEFSKIIFSTIREATLVLDEDLRVRSANKTFYTLFKVREEETEGRLIYELGNRQWNIPQLRYLLTEVITRNTHVEAFEVIHTFPGIGEKILLLNAHRVVRQQEAILLAIEDITDHRQAQRLLAEREAFLHTLVDNAPVLIWVAGTNGRYTFFNKAWLDYTGHLLEEATTLGWEHDIHPDDRESYLSTYNMALKSRQPFQVEFRLKRHDGDYRWMLMNAKPNVFADGTFNGYIGSCAEIYNRKTLLQALDLRAQQRIKQVQEVNASVQRAQRELTYTSEEDASHKLVQHKLAQSEELLRTLIENTPDVITRWDADLKLVYANPAFEKKTGVPNAELLGKTNQEMGQMNEISLPYMDKLRKVLDTGVPQTHYNTFPTPNGIAYFYSSMVPERAPNGSIKSVLAIARDISDLNLVEEIQQTAVNLQAVLNSSQSSIALLKAIRTEQYQVINFQLMVCNQEFAQFVGQPMEQLMGQPVTELESVLWQEETLDRVRQVLSTGKPFYEERYKADTNKWLTIALAKFDDGVVLTARDITDLKKADQQQQHWLSELEKSNENIQVLAHLRQRIQERSELLRHTAHDLRGNFGILQGAATLLDMAETDEERVQMLAMLQRNLQQATRMLTELLDFSRLEAGQEERHLASFDAADLLRKLVESIKPLADERGLTLQSEGNTTLVVDGDAIKVNRIAQNLLLNALKYTQQGGLMVSWGAAAADDRWQLTITDTGPGQWEENQSTASEGIGLIIVKQLCELLDGQLDIDSQAGVGTRFQVTLPRQYPA